MPITKIIEIVVPNIWDDKTPVIMTDNAVAYPFNTESACFKTKEGL